MLLSVKVILPFRAAGLSHPVAAVGTVSISVYWVNPQMARQPVDSAQQAMQSVERVVDASAFVPGQSHGAPIDVVYATSAGELSPGHRASLL